MAPKPYSIIFFVAFFSAQAIVFASTNPDPLYLYTSRNKASATGSVAGDAIRASAVLPDEDVVLSQRIPVVPSRTAQVTQSFEDQVKAVEVLVPNSVVTLAPVHPSNVFFDALPSPGLSVDAFRNAFSGLAALAQRLSDAVKAAQKADVQAQIPFVERLCAGPELTWDKGIMGIAAFVARGVDKFWNGAPPSSAPTAYNAYKYWLVKGPHRDGDRFNVSNQQPLKYGVDQKFRLENISRIGNLTVTDVKSPFAKIFEGTESPVKDKYTVVNLSGVGSGIGSAADDWYCLSSSGGLLDTALESSGTNYVLKGRSIVLKNGSKALAMPLYHKDIDPDFGVGLSLIETPGWTTGKSGPTTWIMDLGRDIPSSAGGTVDQGGLIKGYPVQRLPVWIWGVGERAYLKPNQPALCIDTRNGKARSWLAIPENWCRTTHQKRGTGNDQYFEWPGDGDDGVGRVNIDGSKELLFPAAYSHYDPELSLWNGQRIFRFSARRDKGGSCVNSSCDYGVFATKPMGGVAYPDELPWVMPKVTGMADGKFDTTAGIESVSEVSARVGDAAISARTNTPRGITKWKFADIYPYAVLVRNAGLGRADAIVKLKQFFGQTVPAKKTPPANIVSKPSNKISYGAMAKLQHKESGQYLTISKFTLPSDSGAFYVTCTPDKNEAGWWMVAPGKDLPAREGGVSLDSGDGIRLIEKTSKKVLCGTNALPPLSINYVAESDSEISPVLLNRYNTLPAAYDGGSLPASVNFKNAANWIVAPQSINPATRATSGVIFKNQLMDGFLSSVNGYQFKPSSASEDWIQEVTIFDAGIPAAPADNAAFETWMISDLVPAPSTRQDMTNAGFEGPLTSFDGNTVFTLTQVAMGTDGCVYGVDGSQNAVKIDLAKKTKEQIATGIKQVAIGVDDTLIMLKIDGTVVMRQSGGSDVVVPGCLGRAVAIGNASTFAAASADGGSDGLFMVNESNQLLGREKRASSIDITDDGYAFGVNSTENSLISKLSIWKKSGTQPWKETVLSRLNESISRVSVGSTRFMALHGHHGGLFVLSPTVGSDVFSNPDVLLTSTTVLSGSSVWQKINYVVSEATDNSPAVFKDICVADAAISSNGDLVVLAGQINDNFEFPIFTKSYAPWPKESDVFNLRVEGGSAILVCDNEHGYLKEAVNLPGQSVGTQSQGAVSQFSMASLDGYVTLQAKSSQAMKNSNSGIGLAKDDKLQNKNMMTAKNNAGVVISAGTKLDATLAADQIAVGFGGEKFKSFKDADAVLEKFMFYAEPQGSDGSLRFKLQSKATKGFLKLDSATRRVVSLQNVNGLAVPVTKESGSIFVISNISSTDLKLQQSLVGKNARDAMTVIEVAFADAKTYGNGVESFLKNITHWLDGVRISPDGWTDFTQTKSEWIHPVTKLKQSMTASDRLTYMLSDSSIQANAFLKAAFAGIAVEADTSEKSLLLKELRADALASNAPNNLGLIKNVKDGSVIALRSKYGVASDGKLTTDKTQFVSELYVAVDPVRNVLTLSRTTAIDSDVQFHMKVVPSPLAAAQNADSGHDASDIQRWMMQASDAIDAAVKRIYVPSLSGATIDSEDIALNAVALKYGPLADTSPATLLPAYFDVDTVVDPRNGATLVQTQITLKGASDGGYWALGVSAADASVRAKTLVRTGLSVIDSETDTLKDNGILDLDIRTQEVFRAGDGAYAQKPVAGAPTEDGYGPAVFEIVVITPVLSALTAAFKKATLDEQVTDFLAVSKQLEKTVDVVTFCQALGSFVKNNIRNSQANWNGFVGNRSARDKFAQCITSIKQLFADDLGKGASSNLKSFVDNLAKILDVARVPNFGVTKSRADIIVDLSAQVLKLQTGSELDKFVTSGSSVSFITNLQRGVSDWFTSVGIAVSDPVVQDDGNKLATIISDYKNAIGMSLSKADRATLDGLSLTLTNSTTQSNPVDILQGIVSANTVNGIVSFGSDAKYSFMSKLWELYKNSTLDPEIAGPVTVDGKIVSRGPVFGLNPSQLAQLSNVILSVTKAPVSATVPGGPFFADDAKSELRSTKNNDGWGWADQPFADLTNTQIINQLAVLFSVPTFAEFTATYLQYLSLSQESLSNLATSENPQDQAQVQRFALRIIALAEQWNSWAKASTTRQKRQELNQFKSLVRSVKSFVRSNLGLKQRTDKLLAVIQSALDQLA